MSDTPTRFLAATDSVHTTAAACDYLAERTVDAVRVVAVVGGGTERRDAADALNVAGARIPDAETEQLSGDPAEAVLAAATEYDADELIIGARGGDPGRTEGLGGTAGAVLAAADRPVVVLAG